MEKKKILITGGAGYLGRSTAEVFLKKGLIPVALDNFSTSHRPSSMAFECLEVELTDLDATRKAFSKMGKVDAIIHFAAKALVPESCEQPGPYFRNNLGATINIAELACEFGVRYLVHSSSCAVYGIPPRSPIPETTIPNPVHPYGETKAAGERILAHYTKLKDLRVLNLRYFNPAGSISGASWGESHDPETHLIPNVVKAFLKKSPVTLYGNDYPTPDGTCVRDFIHVEDLVEAHWLALRYLLAEPKEPVQAINIGRGTGNSVLEVIRAAEKALGGKIDVKIAPRRAGDPPELVAATDLMKKVFQWTPAKTLENMLLDHLNWVRSRQS